jgi:hypothetical protein
MEASHEAPRRLRWATAKQRGSRIPHAGPHEECGKEMDYWHFSANPD